MFVGRELFAEVGGGVPDFGGEGAGAFGGGIVATGIDEYGCGDTDGMRAAGFEFAGGGESGGRGEGAENEYGAGEQ